jgi:hypothetical protein
MTPSHVRKGGIKYRYYISSALLQGRAKQAGTVSRIPADEIEALVAKSVRGHLNEPTEIADAILVHNHVARIEVQFLGLTRLRLSQRDRTKGRPGGGPSRSTPAKSKQPPSFAPRPGDQKSDRGSSQGQKGGWRMTDWRVAYLRR